MYGKLFSSMYDGTLGTRGPWEALVTFQQLVILADADGVVDMTPEAIARRTTVPIEVIRRGIEALEQPDAESRTPDEDGRRIIRLSDARSWGWRLVNYSKYRSIRTSDDRRAYMRQYQRDRRARLAGVNNDVNNVNSGKPNKPKQRHRHKQIDLLSDESEKKRSKAPKTNVPDDFEVTDAMSDWAVEIGVSPTTLKAQTERFLDHHRAKGSAFSDWRAAWRTWMRNSVDFAERGTLR